MSIIAKIKGIFAGQMAKNINPNEVKTENDSDFNNTPKTMEIKENEDSIFEDIPVYSRDDFNAAIEDNTDEGFRILYRICLNGYTTYFDDEWVVGRNAQGQLIKSKSVLVTYCSTEHEKKQRMETIDKVQKKAVRGSKINDKIFVKFTYDIKDQDLFSISVELMKEYSEGEIYEDCGTHGGIHFVDINKIESCARERRTVYGNKVAIIKVIDDHVYYNYTEDFYLGDAVFVEKVMYLDDVETWKYLNELTNNVKCYKNTFVEYLELLRDGRDYSKSIEYIKSL